MSSCGTGDGVRQVSVPSVATVTGSATNRLIGEVVQSRRRPLLGRNYHEGPAAIRHYANQPVRPL